MTLSTRHVLGLLAAIAFASEAGAVPIAGVTYQYNPALVSADGNGDWSFNASAKDSDETKLTDGVPGSDAITSGDTVAFVNGTWSGYFHNGGDVGQPRVDFDLGGTFQVQSVEVQYLIEAAPFIFAPQFVDNGGVGDLDAMTVFGSTDGTNFTPLAATNDFEPIFGPTGSIALGTLDARTAVLDFGPGGVSASHLRLDVRTPFDWIFLGEVTINAVPEPTSSCSLLGLGLASVIAAVRRRT